MTIDPSLEEINLLKDQVKLLQDQVKTLEERVRWYQSMIYCRHEVLLMNNQGINICSYCGKLCE